MDLTRPKSVLLWLIDHLEELGRAGIIENDMRHRVGLPGRALADQLATGFVPAATEVLQAAAVLHEVDKAAGLKDD